VSTMSNWDQVIDQALADIDKHQHAAPLTNAPSQRPPGGRVKPVTYAPVKVDAEAMAKAVADSDNFRTLLGQEMERQLKWLMQPGAFVAPNKESEPDAIEARFRYYCMNIGPTIQGTFYIPPDPAPTIDPLDVEYDGSTLRKLLEWDTAIRREDAWTREGPGRGFTPAQRDAVSAHWAEQLRAKVAASAEADKARETSVVVDLEDW